MLSIANDYIRFFHTQLSDPKKQIELLFMSPNGMYTPLRYILI